MKKGLRFQIIGLFCALAVSGCITGCGRRTSGEGDGGTWQRKERVEHDLASGLWEEPEGTVDSGEPWRLTDYWEDAEGETAGTGMRIAGHMGATDGSTYYLLERYIERYKKDQTEPDSQKYFLTCLDTLTMQAEKKELVFLTKEAAQSGGQQGTEDADSEGMGEDKEQEVLQELAAQLNRDMVEKQLTITGMDTQDDRLCLFVFRKDREKKEVSHYYALWLDREGNLEGAVDLLPGIEQAGMRQGDIFPDYIRCDREGRFYVGEETIGVFGSDGTFLKLIEAPGGSENPVFCTGRLPDGRLVFECNMTGGDIEIFCLEGLEEKSLYQGSGSVPDRRSFNAFGEIFFMEAGGLLRWDARSGDSETIYSDSSLGAMGMECDAIIENSAEEVVGVFNDGNTTFALRLRLGGEVPATDISIFVVSGSGDLEKIDEYCRRHPGVQIEVQEKQEGETMDGAMTRLTAQLSQGEGPDLFLLSMTQLKVLQEQGVLEDLTEAVPEEIKDQIFPKVLQGGMIGGKLYGIIDSVSVDTVLVSKEVWQEDTWTFRDVMRLVEEGGFDSVFGTQSPERLIYSIVAKDVAAGNSSLVDREKGECHFDSEEFIRLLELCRKYGTPPEEAGNLSSQEQWEQNIKAVKEGRALAYCSVGNLMSFSRDMAALGEGYSCVGYPTDGEYAGYVVYGDCYGMNADSENKEAAQDFLWYLLGDKVQKRNGITTVRKDILCDNVADGAQPGESPVFWCDKRAVIPLEGRPDGSSFLPEYLEILEKGGWVSMWSDEIGMIISEEAAAYFSGDKTAEAAAEVIQNRVMLYLNE